MPEAADGAVVWITGLSGVGKSAVGAHLRDLYLAEFGVLPVVLDGDQLRRAYPQTLGYGERDRRLLAASYGRLAYSLAVQGHLVIVCTISLFHDVQAWNRHNIPSYREVLLLAPDSELTRRGGERTYLPSPLGEGVTAPEFPLAPDLTINNWGATSAAAAASLIFSHSETARG